MRGVNRAGTCKICATETRLQGTTAKTASILRSGVHKCKACGELRPVEKFHRRDRLTAMAVCEDCKKEKGRKRVSEYRKTLVKPIKTHYICKACEKLLPKESFTGKNKNTIRVKSDSICLDCHRAKRLSESQSEERKLYRKEYYTKNSAKVRRKARDWYEENKDYASLRDKLWREKNKERKQEVGRVYASNNKDKIREKQKKFYRSPARWSTFGLRIPPMDEPKEVNGTVEVVCKNCKSRFIATAAQCQRRIQAAETLNKGEMNFYCSESCKRSCDIYRAIKLPASQRHRRSKARSCQQDVKRSLIANQCSENGMVQCEICGDVGSVDLHHTLPVNGYEDRINEAASMMLVCAGCHMKLHQHCK
jgi:hypothetical protein